jgi:hypothetical protein
VPPLVVIPVPVFAEATTTIMVPEVDNYAALEDCINKITKAILVSLTNKLLPHYRVDPVLMDVPPGLPSVSYAYFMEGYLSYTF